MKERDVGVGNNGGLFNYVVIMSHSLTPYYLSSGVKL